MGHQREYDAIVIGSGLSGSTLTYRLSQHGLKVLIVDRGEFLRQPLSSPNDVIGLHMKTFGSNRSFVGGVTKFYGAAMYRFREADFQAVQHEAGESPAWPISYRQLEPYYCEAERLFHVHGASDGDPTEPVRSESYPYPPLPHAPLVARMIDRLTDSGTQVSPIPRAVDYGPGGKCVLCSTCDAYYCRLDAKMDAEIAALRPAMKGGNVDVLTGTECTRILTDDSGIRATGVRVLQDGREWSIFAEKIAICAGLGPSAQLLIQSSSPTHPRGLGNSTGCVGRYYGGHITGMVFPLLSARKLPAMHSKTFAISTYYHGASDWPYPLGMIQAAGQIPFWEAVSWWQKPAARLIGERSLYCFFMNEAIPTAETGFEYDRHGQVVRVKPPLLNVRTVRKLRHVATEVFKRAGYAVVGVDRRALWHTVGTVRFGLDPESSVLDANCKVHDLDNLYVVDASVLPSAGAVNTGLTIAALALRTGDAMLRSTCLKSYESTVLAGRRGW
jgi:choline dehydrogenase-like flavoprotein